MPADLTPEDGPLTPDEQAMGEDGFTSARRWMPMRHPVFKPTREYLAANPLPVQKNRRAA